MMIHHHPNRLFLALFYLAILATRQLTAQQSDEANIALARQVLNRLSSSAGNVTVKPRLRYESTEHLAYFLPAERTIVVSPELFALAEKHGSAKEAALAYIIGHEYAHYARGHSFDGKFAHSFGEMISSGLGRLDLYGALAASKKDEVEADYYGMFYAYLAGYRFTSLQLTNFMDSLAAIYGDGGGTHPEWSSRQMIVDTVLRDIENLALVHYAANACMLEEQYAVASRLFGWISTTIPIPEVLWNHFISNALLVQRITRRSIIEPSQLLSRAVFKPTYRSAANNEGGSIDYRGDVDVIVDECSSILDVLASLSYDQDLIGLGRNFVSTFVKSEECRNCVTDRACALHTVTVPTTGHTLMSTVDVKQCCTESDLQSKINFVRRKMSILSDVASTSVVTLSDNSNLSIARIADRNKTLARIKLKLGNEAHDIHVAIEYCATACPASPPIVYTTGSIQLLEQQRVFGRCTSSVENQMR